MSTKQRKQRPGFIRDAIVKVLKASAEPITLQDIEAGVTQLVGNVCQSSVRSYLRLNTPLMFSRESRGTYALRLECLPGLQNEEIVERSSRAVFVFGHTQLYNADCFEWLDEQSDSSVHAVVTDPPYGLHEYAPEQQVKLRAGKGGVWRLPPAFDGNKRSPLPRFTVLSKPQLDELEEYFYVWGRKLLPKLVPGAHVVVASNPLLSHIVSTALAQAGLERRGEIIRLVMTMRGGDRPKAAHEEFPEISVMPRSMWEPWLIYRKPIEGRVQDNLRKWKVGGFRRPSAERPFGDVIRSAPTRAFERRLAPHPSLKPQAFMRQLTRAVLPLGQGIIADPFAGAGSTLAAAASLGYHCVGTEKDPHYFDIACKAIPRLAALKI